MISHGQDLEVSKNMQVIGNDIRRRLKEITGSDSIGFSLVVFNTEKESRLNYLSNCNRDEVIQVFEELLNGWKGGMPDIPGHTVQ